MYPNGPCAACGRRASIHVQGGLEADEEPIGDYVEAHPRWATFKRIDTEYAEAVRAGGGSVDVINLPEIGIRGNSHMMMQDKNNAQIVEVIQSWLVKRGLSD